MTLRAQPLCLEWLTMSGHEPQKYCPVCPTAMNCKYKAKIIIGNINVSQNIYFFGKCGKIIPVRFWHVDRST